MEAMIAGTESEPNKDFSTNVVKTLVHFVAQRRPRQERPLSMRARSCVKSLRVKLTLRIWKTPLVAKLAKPILLIGWIMLKPRLDEMS